jgi:fucose 4-O-acetylase-like acetyltransferase
MMKTEIKKRIGWVDDCRGLAIVLVVFGHVVQGLERGGVLNVDSPYITAEKWVYLFHMPVFFLLSGLFACRASGCSWFTVAGSKIRTLAYPYVLWTGIYVSAQILMARYVNNQLDLAKAARLLWEPYIYGLWFLYALFVIALLFHGLILARVPRWWLLVGSLGLHLAAWFNLFSFWPIFNTAMLNFVFFVLGGIFHKWIFATMERIKTATAIGGGILLFGLMTILHETLGGFSLPLALVFALPGIGGLILLARGMGPLGMITSFLGVYSLEIYLGHPLFSTAPRAVLSRLGFHAPIVYIGVCVLAGVVGSLMLALGCKRLNFPFLFRWPQERKSGIGKH